MAMTMEEFLSRYFRQLHFDTMPEAQKRQFDSYVDKDDFRGDMKSWRNDLLKKGPDGKPFKDSNGHYVHNDLPDGTRGATKMEDKDWDDLYLGLYNTFVDMDAKRKNLSRTEDGKKALAFVDKYFGDDEKIYTFSLQKLDASVKEEIDKLLTIFKNDPTLYNFVGINTRDDREKLESFIGKKDKLDKPESRNLVYRLVSELNYEIRSNSDFISYVQQAKTFDGFDLDNLGNIQEALYKEREVTDNDRKKLQRDIGEILKTLHSNSKIYSVFKANDKSKISELMDEAIAKTDYTGKTTEKDYIKPKYEDTLDWRERLQKNTKAFYDDKLKKYLTAHRDHVYKLDTAKAIGDVITGLKNFSYNDELGKIIKDNKDDIIKALHDKQPLESIDHFEWFVSQIESFQKNGKSKDVAGALRDGDKMNDLVEDLAINAIDEAKNGKKDSIEKAKTAMEVLKVLQQPFFSGKTLDAIRKTDFTLFSDGNLSFNKSNPYIKGVMGAVDKTIGAAIKGAALVGTGVASLYNRRNLGFNKTGALEEGHQQFVKDN
ncbi:MAG: hypothetical protein J6S57_01795, partial [Alphaproteobacteria bacterium]|nr:hypothetical protein [Alphaproteobacteria bacterium]